MAVSYTHLDVYKRQAIYFVHAKDTRLDPLNGPVNGMLDTKRFTCEQERSWLFRTVGYRCV